MMILNCCCLASVYSATMVFMKTEKNQIPYLSSPLLVLGSPAPEQFTILGAEPVEGKLLEQGKATEATQKKRPKNILKQTPYYLPKIVKKWTLVLVQLLFQVRYCL